MGDYSVLIVDDELDQVRVIEDLLKRSQVDGQFEVEVCTSLADMRQRLAKGYIPHIVFMDIAFEEHALCEGCRDGIDAAQRLLSDYPGVQLIYVTGHVDQCRRVYRTDHIYCLIKPIIADDFEDALAKAVGNIKARALRPFGVKSGGRIVRVVPSKIEYIESDRRKVHIFTDEGSIEAYESLSGLAANLPDGFIQCHKSFLVNMEKIVEMRSDAIDLASGATIPVSQKRSRAARAAFMAYLRDRL